jgi:hypothetical protein
MIQIDDYCQKLVSRQKFEISIIALNFREKKNPDILPGLIKIGSLVIEAYH